MQTQPNVIELFIPPIGAPRWVMVFQAIWEWFAGSSDAKVMEQQVSDLPGVSGVELYDAKARGEIGLPIEYMDADTKAYAIGGIYKGSFRIDEWAGELADAKKNHRWFVDKPGNDLCVRITSYPPSDGEMGTCELYWGTKAA